MASLTRSPLWACKLSMTTSLACPQRGGQNLFDIQREGGGIGRSLQDHGRSHAIQGEGGDQCRVLAAVAWSTSAGSLPLWSTRIQGRQSKVGATFIDKDQLLGGMLAGLRSPGGSLLFVALAGTHRLFFRVQPNCSIARLIVQRLTTSPWVCSHNSQCCSSVASSWARSCASSPACKAARFLGVRPGIAWGFTCPSSRRCLR